MGRAASRSFHEQGPDSPPKHLGGMQFAYVTTGRSLQKNHFGLSVQTPKITYVYLLQEVNDKLLRQEYETNINTQKKIEKSHL